MPKGAKTCCDMMQMMFMGQRPAWLDQEDFWIGLHTADPSKGDQSTSEVSYFGYQRQRIGREGWECDDETVANKEFISFPVNAGSSTEKIRYVSIGTGMEGAGQVIYAGLLKAGTVIRQNHRLRFPPGTIVVTEV